MRYLSVETPVAYLSSQFNATPVAPRRGSAGGPSHSVEGAKHFQIHNLIDGEVANNRGVEIKLGQRVKFEPGRLIKRGALCGNDGINRDYPGSTTSIYAEV
jgi:hypothetical protein